MSWSASRNGRVGRLTCACCTRGRQQRGPQAFNVPSPSARWPARKRAGLCRRTRVGHHLAVFRPGLSGRLLYMGPTAEYCGTPAHTLFQKMTGTTTSESRHCGNCSGLVHGTIMCPCPTISAAKFGARFMDSSYVNTFTDQQFNLPCIPFIRRQGTPSHCMHSRAPRHS